MPGSDEFADPLPPEAARAIDLRVAQLQTSGRVPTLVAAVFQGPNLRHFARAGERAADPDTQFRIGSITKTMTATLVLQLRDEGRLSLDAPLAQHLPESPVGGLTLRQLLAHVSGLQREPDGAWWERSRGHDLDALVAGVGPEKLAYQPYRGHHYSNLAYGLLGAVLQQVTGEPWFAHLEQRLLGPLGLTRTTYHPQEPFARGYVVHPWHATLREEPRHDARAMAPAGQLWSTLADLGRWGAFLAEPDPAVLAPATLAEMCLPVAIADPQHWRAGHGLGLALWRRGDYIFAGHAGSMPGYLAVLAVHRASGVSVAAFTDAYTIHGGSLTDFGTELLATALELAPATPPAWRPAAEPPPPEAAELCGRWWWMGQEYAARWDAAAAELVITPRSEPAGEWRFRPDRAGPGGGDRWRGFAGMNDGELLTVRRDPARAGNIELEIATLIFTRDPDGPG